MAVESIAQRVNNIQDPETARSILALLGSIVTDLATLKAAHNSHVHVVSGAATTTLSSGTVGNLNTTA
jgi:hypothetical protein